MPTKYDHFVEAANQAAHQGKWEVAFENLTKAHKLKPEDVGVLTGLAQCALQLGQKQEALTLFRQVIILAPDSSDAHNNLGYIQGILGQWDEAESSYQMAITLDPDNVQAWKNLAWMYLRSAERAQDGVNILYAVVQADPKDVEAWYLLGECYEEIRDFTSAKALYENILRQAPGYPLAVEALERIAEQVAYAPPQSPVQPVAPDLAPVDRIARPEHAKKLASLKDLIKKPASDASAAQTPSRVKLVAFYGPAEMASEARLSAPARALSKAGYDVKLGVRLEDGDADKVDVFVIANPHLSAGLMEVAKAAMQAAKQRSGVRVMVDLDRDFISGTAEGANEANELKALLAEVDFVTTPSISLARLYNQYASRVDVIPSAWSQADVMWDKPAPKRKTVNLGVVNTHTQRADVGVLKEGIRRLLEESSEAMLVVGGDMALYDAFDGISEERKTYVPVGQVKDYPYLLANFDVLLVPLGQGEFNQNRSDLPLLEAGIRRIPWIASPNPAFQEWGFGGLFAIHEADWLVALRKLIGEPALRQELGGAGRQKAEGREADQMVRLWKKALEE